MKINSNSNKFILSQPIILPKNIDVTKYQMNKLFSNVKKLKKQIREKERNQRKNLEKINVINFNFNAVNKEEMLGYKFNRNPFEDSKMFKFDFKKHKMKMNLIIRNNEKSRITNALNNVVLHFVKIKSKLNLKSDELLDLKNKILNKKKRNFSSNFTKNNNINKIKVRNKSALPKNINNFENETKNIHLNTKSDSSITNYLGTNIKSRNIKTNLYSSKSKSEFVLPTHGKTYYYIKEHYKSNNSKKKYQKIKNIKLFIKNNNIYNSNLKNLINDYDKLKIKLKKEKEKFLSRSFLDQKDINYLMDIRNDMKIMCLKQKYLSLKHLNENNKKSYSNENNKVLKILKNYCEKYDGIYNFKDKQN